MDLRQMEYFLAVAEEQQFTRAASLRRVSQSGLSASIRTLEEELDTVLFTRTTRNVELTDAGRALVPHARSMLAQAAAGRDAVEAMRGEVLGTLRVGAEQCLGVIDLSEILGRFCVRYPKVRVTFQQAGTGELRDLLRAGDLDVAFVASEAGEQRGSVQSHKALNTLSTEPMVVICSPTSAISKRPRVEFEDLRGAVFVDFHSSWAVRAINDKAFADRQLTRDVRFTVNDVHTLLEMVHRQVGVAIVPRPIARKPQAEGLKVLALEGVSVPAWALNVLTASEGKGSGLAGRLTELFPDM
jgi:DNA-binding transcriptional LysR family regulator